MKRLLAVLLCIFYLASCTQQSDNDGQKIFVNRKKFDIDFMNVDVNFVVIKCADIKQNPADYYGKTIRVGGYCYNETDADHITTTHYLMVIDEDGTEEIALEFRAQDNYYPENDTIIEVDGVITALNGVYFIDTEGVIFL